MSESKEKVTEEQSPETETEGKEKITSQEEQDQTEEEEEVSLYEEMDPEEIRKLLRERDEQVDQLEHELSQAKEGRLRKAAELENYRKRVQRERSQIYETAKANALEDFLFVNDDLRRTLKAAEDLDVDETFLDGVTLVAEKFEEVLKKHGVERIDKEGVPFDVDIHDAMMRQKPENDDVESDVVLNVVENGYRIGDRTIRHAKVIVSE